MKKPPNWTDLEIRHLKQLIAEGKTNREIAAILERSFYSITSQRQRQRLVTQPKKMDWRDPILIAQIVKFRMAGWQTKDIAKAFDVGHHTITKMLCKTGLSKCVFRKRRLTKPYLFWTEIEMARLRKICGHFHMLGFTEQRWEHLARHFPNRTKGAVRQRANAMMRYWRSPDEIKERQYLRAKYKRTMTVDFSTIGKLERG